MIVLDLAMPRKTGLGALREIARVAPDAKVIIFSGFSIASVGSDLSALGAVLYLQKGASPDAILEAIEEAGTEVHRSRPFAPLPQRWVSKSRARYPATRGVAGYRAWVQLWSCPRSAPPGYFAL